MSSSSASSDLNLSGPELINEMVKVCAEASKGNLEARILHTCDEPQMQQIANAINSLLDSTDVFLRESTASLKAASEHRYYRRVIERGMHGTFRHGANLLNSASKEMHDQFDQLQKSDIERSETLTELGSTLNASASRISDAIKEISRITKATHILALNAKIEAARAGDAGRGFAIVAHEVELTSQRINDVMSRIDGVFAEFTEETQTVWPKLPVNTPHKVGW
jgi:methyl-accepting chemotaxis protein